MKTCLDRQVYLSGMKALCFAFKYDLGSTEEKQAKSLDIYWEFLRDIPTNLFDSAVKQVCISTQQLYPHSNLIAIIRAKAAYYACPQAYIEAGIFDDKKAEEYLAAYEKNKQLGIVG